MSPFIFQITAGFKVPTGKYIIIPSLVSKPADYGFILRISGQIIPTTNIHSLIREVRLPANVNTDTGVVKKGINFLCCFKICGR